MLAVKIGDTLKKHKFQPSETTIGNKNKTILPLLLNLVQKQDSKNWLIGKKHEYKNTV